MDKHKDRQVVNLGLVKAIFTGINEPFNKKVLWYDENPGQFIHKYYDIKTSSWVPLGNMKSDSGSDLNFYQAYASNNKGANFSLTYNKSIHKYTSIISSENELTPRDLVATLFEDKWIKYSIGEENDGGNFTYLAFADTPDGGNFGLEHYYLRYIETCKYLNSEAYKINSKPSGDVKNYKLLYNNEVDSVTLMYENNSPTLFQVDIDEGKLDNGIPYMVEINIPINNPTKFYVRLDGNEKLGYLIEHKTNDAKSFRFEKISYGSKLFIEFEDGSTIKPYKGSMEIRIGTMSCSLDNSIKELRICRKFWGQINSKVAIKESDLKAEMFKDKWVHISGYSKSEGSGGGGNSDLENRLNTLEAKQSEDYKRLSGRLTTLENLNAQLNERLESLDKRETNNYNTLNSKINTVQLDINKVKAELADLKTEVEFNTDKLSDEQFIPRVKEIIKRETADSSISGEELMQLKINSANIGVSWRNGESKYKKSSIQNTTGVQMNIFSRNGYLGNSEPSLDAMSAVKYINSSGQEDKKLWEITSIPNLIIEIEEKYWNSIINYNPFLEIRRYKPSRNKGKDKTNNKKNFSDSGYKLNETFEGLKPGRILLGENRQVVDFGQEHYFKVDLDFVNSTSGSIPKKVRARGMGNSLSSKLDSKSKKEGIVDRKVQSAFVYLELRLGITYNGEYLISNELAKVKMSLILDYDESKNIYNNLINFKNL